MKPTSIHSVAIIMGTFLCKCLLVGCHENSGEAEQPAMKFQGEATIEYLERPGAFGSKGVLLKFENFNLAEGVDETYVLKNLPASEQPYRLLFMPEPRLSDDLSDSLQIATVLEDSTGKQYWNVETPLSKWRISEVGGRTEHFYMVSTKTGVVECAFMPSSNTEYRLHIRCKVSNTALTETKDNKKVRFCLRAGGYK